MWCNIHESSEQCREVRWQNDCLQSILTDYEAIGRMPVNEENRRFSECALRRRYNNEESGGHACVSRRLTRNTIETKSRWYVIQTLAGQEDIVKQMAEKYLPKDCYEECRILYYVRKKRYRGEWHEVKERFLPGYLFLVAEDPWPAREALKKVPRFSKLIRDYEDNEIYPISPEEEQFLKRLSGDGEEVDLSYGVIEGDAVRIISGGLMGLESVIRKIDRHKRVAYIEMRIFGEIKLLEVGLEVVEKTG